MAWEDYDLLDKDANEREECKEASIADDIDDVESFVKHENENLHDSPSVMNSTYNKASVAPSDTRDSALELYNHVIDTAKHEADDFYYFVNEVFKQMPAYVVVLGKDQRVWFMSDWLAKTAYKTADEVKGKTAVEALDLTDRDKAQVDIVFETGESIINKEIPLPTKDGKVIPTLASAVPIRDRMGRIIGAVEVLMDITPIKEKEKELRNLLDYMSRSASKIREAVSKVATGDLRVRLKKERSDDIGEIMDQFNNLVNLFSETVSDIIKDTRDILEYISSSVSAVSQVKSGIQQIAAAARQIAQGSDDLAKTVAESSRECRGVTNAFNAISSKMKETVKFVEKTVSLTEDVTRRSREAITMLHNITVSFEGFSKVVANLVDSAKAISKVTETIKRVADQTNLLALNAAIEAARAGEHGRGFAVVAEEIRKLADETKKSTEKINDVIRSVVSSVQEIDKMFNEVTSTLHKGKEVIGKALENTANILHAAKKTETMVKESSSHVDDGLRRINILSSNLERLAATAEESAAASEETSSAVQEQASAIEELSKNLEELERVASEILSRLEKRFKL